MRESWKKIDANGRAIEQCAETEGLLATEAGLRLQFRAAVVGSTWLAMCIIELIVRWRIANTGRHQSLEMGRSHEQRLLSAASPPSRAVDLISHAAVHAPVVPAYQHAAPPDLVCVIAAGPRTRSSGDMGAINYRRDSF